ncbi:MAG: sugar transferase [Hyphomicrobiaceae bacterium]|nr:sugar transferase [Hyphomicrobiaceae bacterium]
MIGYPGKRLLDILGASIGLLVFGPVIVVFAIAIWLYDFHSPFYFGRRIGRGGRIFHMVKLRSMVVNADKAGGSTTKATDNRITPMGRLVRRFKLDEVTQLWNVLVGDMSLIGPRPQVESDVKHYTAEERQLLDVRPGISDLSSIVFSDEGDILAGSSNPDLDYCRLIRPWKLRLGLLYVRNASLTIDLTLIYATVVAIVAKSRALAIVQNVLRRIGADQDVVQVAARRAPLQPQPLPNSLAEALSVAH